ncbi:ABC transporter permease [Candidatus Methylopumilus universalis]|uniref:ABC transporter permease n=1 Tax=Candidatus Methylopumilus universalis TaxID=2588536 RepID=UPI00111E4EA4|nr:ABC transporter permease [Candidatus Methylopumilus universalis]QDC80374.1 ABC transporter permease [Candidatus Methylopumilus universalis]QDC81675.1 ABC transporter permease [Candidatus Methylopumilus universalis]
MTLHSALKSGLEELNAGLVSHEQWLYMAVQDIRLRYRRSMIGPWWVTISTGVMVMMLGFLWSHIFSTDLQNYLPFFAVGFVLWGWMSGQVLDAAGGFFQFQGIIKQVKLPFPIFVLRLNVRQCIVLLHNSIIIALVLLFMGKEFSLVSLMAVPNLILIQLNLTLLSIVITIFCTRYQDMTQVVNVGTQIAFFFTPILWQEETLKDRTYLAEMNPVYHWIEMVRSPLLGRLPTMNDYIWSIASLILLLGLAAYYLGRYRSRIAYWL